MNSICLLFLTYSNITHIDAYDNFLDNCNIYIHPKYPENVDSSLQKYIIPTLIETKWGDKSIINATIELLKESYKNNDNKWFILCSEDMFPLVNYTKLSQYLTSQKYSIFDIMDNSKNKTSQFWALKRDDVSKILSNRNKWNDIFDKIPKKTAVDELFFLPLLKLIDPNYKFTNSKICYVKWFKNFISKHPTTFNCLLQTDLNDIERNHSCFIRKTYSTFQNELCPDKRLTILLVYGSESISDFSVFLNDFSEIANIFILSMLDSVNNSQIKNHCCQTYYVVWNDLENAIKEIKKTLKGDLIVTSEKLNVNRLKNMLEKTKLKDENNNTFSINFNIDKAKFFFDEYMSKQKEEENPESKKEAQKQNIELDLQLGDVIQISNPVNEILNNQVFMIDYIDKTKAFLINTDSLDRIKIKISQDGILGDGNITQIDILSRADTPSYAIQNGLRPGKWVNIYFGGDFPVIITGEITNLEKDMIEITTTDKDIIYINFDYKGIPEDLPIENIEIREKPSTPLKPTIAEDIEEDKLEFTQLEEEKNIVPIEQIDIVVPTKDVKDQLREFIVKADQIKFGDEELGPIVQYIDVSDKSQRYSIETQVSDLLDDLLSTVPNTQRTPRVLNNIHIMIERFKQLREKFSFFDQYGNVEGILLKEASYKPLQNWLNKFNINLYWILPVVKNIKKMYDIYDVDSENDGKNDIIHLDLRENIQEINELLNTYKSSESQSDNNNYSNLYNDLNSYFTPFNLIDDENMNEIITEKDINTNLNVIIDNLSDLYSSVFSNNMVRNRRFVITRYNLGETKLDATDLTGAKMTTVRIPMTKNDVMSIKSIITLPEPTIRFSKINLPGSDILSRANLNEVFLNYWQLLKRKTNVNTTFVDSLDMQLEFDENTFVNSIKNYTLNLSDEDLKKTNTKELYKSFVDIIVPKTKIVFNLMKKYIRGKLSIIEVVSYLEPFMIYTDDLTFKQYEEITRFIDDKISEYNKNMIELSRIFKILSTIKDVSLLKSRAFSVVDLISNDTRHDIFDLGYNVENTEYYTNSELLKRLTIKDYARLYTSRVAIENLKLMFPQDVTDIFNVEKRNNEDKIKDEEKNDKCETVTIAKFYNSLDQLENDNGKTIYFDKRYDKTNYGIMEDEKNGYAKEVINLTPEKLKDHIVNDQIKKNKLSEIEAGHFADTLINGIKKVIDGQYAILYKGLSSSDNFIQEESDYYIRKDGKWVLDKDLIKTGLITDESSIICDLQEKCISVPTKLDDNCESMKVNELNLQNSLLKEIINEFDSKYKVSKEEFERNIKQQYEYFMSIMPIVSKIETNTMLKYNNQKYKIGINTEDEDKNGISSPFSPLLDIILGQKDFAKKQTDIVKFCDKFTRTFFSGLSQNGQLEDSNWLYCIKTSVRLIPAFKKELASAFINSGYHYKAQLEKVKARIGQLSDDGDWWTDKHSGWPICPGDFDVDEGFEEGFKASSRAVMEEDAGSKIMAATTEKTIKYNTIETIMINNIVNALSVAMGINIETQKEFIINAVIETIRNTVESESSYKDKVKEASQKGKSLPSYRDFFNTSLLYYTLGMFLIAVQTSMPSIKTRKTHPGCVRSFTGYPFDGQTDLGSLTYLACVTYDIRESGEPWNVLKKINAEKIQTRIKAAIDGQLIQLPEVQRKFAEKTEYLLTVLPSDIPAEHDIAQWSDFLPPLIPFKIRHLVNISDEFKRSLRNDLNSGSENQREKILVIESKIIQFSLAIQERIQNIVKKHKVLLHTSNNEPYLENACCDSKENEPTIDYFTSRDNDIIEFNNIVSKLDDLLHDVRAKTEAVLFYSNINTKNIYPPISNIFDEKTIYLAFIFYCKFKSLLPIPEDLLPICTNKPDSTLINQSDSIERIIQKLKEDGRNYTNQQFLKLIQLISRENIVHIELDNPIISCVTKLSKLIESIRDENNENEIIEQSVRDLIYNAIDSFDIASEKVSSQVKELNNFLAKSNDEMINELTSFIQNNSGQNVSRKSIRKFIATVENISKWNFDESIRNDNIKISNETMYNITNFYKTFISNFVKTFPNIILNKVNYDNTLIPSYYKFSKNHANKLKTFISEYFQKLKPFYNVDSLSNLLTTIQINGKNAIKLAQNTPCFSSIKFEDKILRGLIDEQTSRYLFEYYLLRVLIEYIVLSDDDSMIVTEVKKTYDVTDIFSVEYIEESETRIDLSMSSRSEQDTRILTGNKRELKQKTAELLVAYMDIFTNEKETIDVTYEDIQDRIFKLKEKEKDMVTDRLKSLTDEARDIDTILKISKLSSSDKEKGNDYSKGLKKGLTVYDKDFYEEEQQMRDELEKAERKIRKKNKDATDENIDILLDEYMENRHAIQDIEEDAYDMGFLNETYYDGNFDGVDAPEEEYGDYADFDS